MPWPCSSRPRLVAQLLVKIRQKLQQHIEKTPHVNRCLFAGGLWRCPLCLQRLAKLYFPSYTDGPLAAHSLGPDFVAHLLVTIYTTRRYDTPRDLIVLLIRVERSLGNTVTSLLGTWFCCLNVCKKTNAVMTLLGTRYCCSNASKA